MLSALAAKIIAVMLGPPGLALIAALQQTRDATVLAATANGRTGLVRGSSALGGVARREYLRTALLIFGAGSIASAVCLILGRHRVALWAGIPDERASLVAWLALPVILTAACVFLNALLNAMGDIGALAWSQMAVAAVIAAGAWPLARWMMKSSSLSATLWLSLSAAAGVIVAAGTLRRHATALRSWFQGTGAWWNWSCARQFFSISGALLATGFLGSVVVVSLRAHIVHCEGLEGAGLFDAAWRISMGHVTLVLAFVQTYYLSALSRARQVGERSELIARALTVVTLVTIPLIATLELGRAPVLTLLYSASFTGASGLLRWTLVGDYLKVTSWVIGMPMLAVADMMTFVPLECAVQGVFFFGALGLAFFVRPSQATALAYLASYALNLGGCFLYARARHGFRVSWKISALWWGGLVLILAVAAI